MKKKKRTAWDRLAETSLVPCSGECASLTTIVPTQNCAHSISLTLDSIASQKYPNLEIIVLDAGSSDRTLDIVKGYADRGVRLISVTDYNVYEMFNRGASFATGRYINFLFPGDFYISPDTLNVVGNLALAHKNPDFIYGACLLRDANRDPRILFRPFDLNSLKRGRQPTSLQSCWWRTDTFASLGKFGTHFKLRGGFDLMCRFRLVEGLEVASTPYVLTDYDRRALTHRMIMLHFLETLPVLIRTFGVHVACRWWLQQKDLVRSFRLWVHGVRIAFFGR